MCSANDDPTTYDAPTPQAPRVYRLSGDAPEPEPARGSIALAVLGTMLGEAEDDFRRSGGDHEVELRLSALYEARTRIELAEAL